MVFGNPLMYIDHEVMKKVFGGGFWESSYNINAQSVIKLVGSL